MKVLSMFKRNHPDMFFKKGVPKNLAKLTGKHLCWSHFLKTANLLKKRLYYSCFPVYLLKFSEHLFPQKTSRGCFCMFNFCRESIGK